MSVLVTDRKESKLEAITFSLELHDILIQFMQRSFGVKNFERIIRSKYGDSTDFGQEMSNSRFLMYRFKVRINDTAMLLTSNVRAANSIYPTTLHECDVRRDYQNAAIGNCEQLIKDLQQIVDVFDVDVNVYGQYIEAIDREIGLIKKWRQRDNKTRCYLQKQEG